MGLLCVRMLVMLQCFRSVVCTTNPQPLLSQHYSPHLSAGRTCALRVLAPTPLSGLWMTASTWRGQIEITVNGARYSVYRPPRFVVPPYCQPPRGQYFLCPRSGLQPHAAHRGCSSVSGSPGDISWYFLPTLRRSQVALQSFTFLQLWHFVI